MGKLFLARIRDGNSVVERSVYADNIAHAERQARRMGDLISVRSSTRAFRTGGMTPTERFQFLNRLATALATRVPPDRALSVIAETYPGRIRVAAETALAGVRAGGEIATVLVADTRNFPSTVGLLIRAGAEAGDAPRALREASKFEMETTKALGSTLKELIGGLSSLSMALIMLGMNKWYVIPKMMSNGLFKAAADLTGKGVDLQPFIQANNFVLYLTICMAVAMLLLFLLSTVGRRLFPDAADNLIQRIPVLREVVLTADSYVAFVRLSFLVRAGVRLKECLEAVSQASRPGALKEDLRRAAIAVDQGRGAMWANDMRSLHPLDRASLAGSVDVNELSETLSVLAEGGRQLYLQRLGMIGPIINLFAMSSFTLAGFVTIVIMNGPTSMMMQSTM